MILEDGLNDVAVRILDVSNERSRARTSGTGHALSTEADRSFVEEFYGTRIFGIEREMYIAGDILMLADFELVDEEAVTIFFGDGVAQGFCDRAVEGLALLEVFHT